MHFKLMLKMKTNIFMESINDFYNILLMDYSDKKLHKVLSLLISFLILFPFANRKVKLFRKSQSIINIYKMTI